MVALAPHLLLLLLPSLASTSPVRVVADGDSLPAAMVSYARMQISNMPKNSMQIEDRGRQFNCVTFRGGRMGGRF